MIELHDVRKSFKEVRALDGISLRAEEGEIFGLLGPNGAGKSTTIKIIMNILAPDSGSILFDGNPIKESDKDSLGYLPEERGLYRRVTVNEMLLYFAGLKGRPARYAQKSIDGWLERFGLSDWKKRRCEALSKGMAQKVQFISCLAHDPEFLLLDEPFVGLDPVGMDELREVIVELRGKGKTILLSTHNMDVAEKLCSRILLIDHGREVISGSMAEVKARHGRSVVVVELDGRFDFKSLDFVAGVTRYPRWVELELAEGADPQALLKALVGRVTVSRFEQSTKSLHGIFLEKVGGRDRARGERGST